jgi:hypothetical protein
VKVRPSIVAATLALWPVLALAQAQSSTAPLIITATVVSTCRVNVQGSSAPSGLSTLPVSVTCARGAGTPPRVQRPHVLHREIRDAVLLIDF